MWRLLLGLALVAQTPSAPAGTQPDAVVSANPFWPLKQARVDAYRAGNRAFFEWLLAADFVTIGPDGRRVGRAGYLAAEFGTAPGGHGLRPETVVSEFAATRTGDTLVMTYRESIRTDVGGQPFTEQLRRLDVYVLQSGRWRLLEQTTGQQEGELLPVGPDLFYTPPDVEARVAFERDAGGRVVAQVYRSGPQALRGPRLD